MVSGREKQADLDQRMYNLVGQFPKVFRATKADDNHFSPVHQKMRPLPFQDKQKDHFGELIREVAVTPLQWTNGTGLITAKKWSEDKIKMNLDTRPMKKVVSGSHYHIPLHA